MCAALVAFAPAARAQSPADTEMPDIQPQTVVPGPQEIQIFPKPEEAVPAKPPAGPHATPLEKAGRLAKKKEFLRALEAIDALSAIEEDGEKTARAYIRGLALKETQQPAEAIPLLREAAADPLLGDWALLNIMETYAAGAEPAQVIVAADEFMERFPWSPQLENAVLMKVQALMDTGLYAKAEALLKERPAKAWKAPERMYQLLAQCLEAEGKNTEAYAAWAEIWFEYPAAPFAAQANIQMDRLRKAGNGVFPASSPTRKSRWAPAIKSPLPSGSARKPQPLLWPWD